MRLGSDDLVYFSEYVDDPGLAYGRRAAGAERPAAALARRAAPSSAARSSTASADERQGPVRRATRPTTSASLCIDVSAGPGP